MGSFLPETPGEYEKSSCFPLINEAVGCLICSLTSTPALQLLLLTPGWETCLLGWRSAKLLPLTSGQALPARVGARGGSAGWGWERALGCLWMSACCRRSPPRLSPVAGGERWLSWQRLLCCLCCWCLARGVGARVGRCQAAWLPYCCGGSLLDGPLVPVSDGFFVPCQADDGGQELCPWRGAGTQGHGAPAQCPCSAGAS